jgi:hypothetical protein
MSARAPAGVLWQQVAATERQRRALARQQRRDEADRRDARQAQADRARHAQRVRALRRARRGDCAELRARMNGRHAARDQWPPPRVAAAPMPDLRGREEPVIATHGDLVPIGPQRFHALFTRPVRQVLFQPPDKCGVSYSVEFGGGRGGTAYRVESTEAGAGGIPTLFGLFSILLYAAMPDMVAHFPRQRDFQVLLKVSGELWAGDWGGHAGDVWETYIKDTTVAIPAVNAPRLFDGWQPNRAPEYADFLGRLTTRGTLGALMERLEEFAAHFEQAQSRLKFAVNKIEAIFFPVNLRGLRGACGTRRATRVTEQGMLIVSPAAPRGFCFFASFMPLVKRKFSKAAARALCESLVIPDPGRGATGVSVEHALWVARAHGVGLRIVDKDDVTMGACAPDGPQRPSATLLLRHGHYARVSAGQLKETRCGWCGQRYKLQHVCASMDRREYYRRKFKEESFVKPKSIAEPELRQDEVAFVDLETLRDVWYEEGDDGPVQRGSGRLEVYAAGIKMWSDATVTVFYGVGCMERLLPWLDERKPKYLAGWHISGFDGPILCRHAHEGGYHVSDLLLHHSKLISAKIEEIGCKLFDLFLFVGSSLAAAAEDFNVPTRKGIFPHRIFNLGPAFTQGRTPWEMVHYVGPWPGLEGFFDKDRKAAHAYLHDPERPPLLDAQRELTAYLESDVNALAELFAAIQHMCRTETWGQEGFVGTNVTRFQTGPQMAYEIWKAGVAKETVEVPVLKEKAAAFSAAFTGGLVRANQLAVESADFARAEELNVDPKAEGVAVLLRAGDADGAARLAAKRRAEFGAIRQFLRCLDKNSMYPSVMATKDFPVGLSRAMTRAELASPPTDKLYIAYAKYKPRRDLFHPVLAQRTKEQLLWSLDDGEGWYTSEDLAMARAEGYSVALECGWIWDKKERLFEKVIKTFMEMKDRGAREGNMVLRNMAKGLANALFGKMGQSAKDEVTVACYSFTEVSDFLAHHEWRDMVAMGSSCVYMVGVKTDQVGSGLTKPMHVAAFITAYSRRELYDVRKMLDPTMSNPARAEKYTDTDCLYLTAELAAEVEAAGLVGKALGQFSDDLLKLQKKQGAVDAKIVRAYFVRPKLYKLVIAFLYADGSVRIVSDFSSKGIPKHTWEVLREDGDALEVLQEDGDFFRLAAEAARGAVPKEAATREVPFESLEFTALRGATPFSHYARPMRRKITAGWTGRVFNPADGYWYPIGWRSAHFVA